MGAERLESEEFYAPVKEVLQKERKAHEIVEGLVGGNELNKQIHIAISGRLVTDE